MKLVAGDIDIDVRAGTVDDIPVLLAFIREMAAFEKLTASATEASLRAALFGESPAARALLVHAEGKAIGYVTYFFSFSTMAGKRCFWLEDLFIAPAFRGKGIGKTLMAYLAGIALQHQCARFEWIVLDWNESAIRFYERLGATILPDWRMCRLDESQLPSLAATLQPRGVTPHAT